jgi:hypothetical protein
MGSAGAKLNATRERNISVCTLTDTYLGGAAREARRTASHGDVAITASGPLESNIEAQISNTRFQVAWMELAGMREEKLVGMMSAKNSWGSGRM